MCIKPLGCSRRYSRGRTLRPEIQRHVGKTGVSRIARDLETGAKTNWDIVPEMQFSLSRRQHILANFGVRTPANNRTGRATELVFYVLWDWFDGGLREGW